MSAPSGYTALDFVGFTDKGTYSPSATYMRNDLVHYGGNIMRCLIDNTTNVTPVVGANWELWVGASANLVERVIAPLENNPADVAYGVGRQIIYDDWLWEVIAPIAVGDALIDYAVDPTNANIKKSAPVETQLLAVKAEADATDNMIAPTETNASSSSAAYAVGDQLILNNILYDVIAAIQIGDALTTGTGGNIAAADSLTEQLAAKANSSDLGTAAAKNSTNAVTSGSTALVESGAVYSEVDSVKQALANEAVTRALTGGHNLLPNNATGQVINGVTFTVNSNTKIVGANGTAQGGNANLFIIGTYTGTTSNAVLTFDKDIILSGGRNENVRVTAFVIHGSSGTVTHYSSTGNHVLIEANGELIYLLGVACQVLNGQTANNDGLYPMIRWATDEYKGYSPYAMTNREITSQLTKLSEAETQTVAGITFKRIGESVVYYGNLTGLANTSYVNIGIAPFLPTEAYSIDNFYDSSAPYTPIGTIWINGNGGAMTIYKDSAKTSGYVSGSYICHL